MRILLVGAGGFIGRHLHAALSAAGHAVLASARRPAPGSDWLRLDLAELARDPQAFAWPAGIELVVNAAGLLSTDRAQLHEVQHLGACALFELAAAHGARVLQISALGAEDGQDTDFLASKAAAERHLLSLGIPAVVLRPSLVLGPGAASSRWLQRLSPLIRGSITDITERKRSEFLAAGERRVFERITGNGHPALPSRTTNFLSAPRSLKPGQVTLGW